MAQAGMLLAGLGPVLMAAALAAMVQEAASAGPVTLEAEAARLNPDRVEVVEQESFASKRGVALKQGVASTVGSPESAPVSVFRRAGTASSSSPAWPRAPGAFVAATARSASTRR